MAGKKTLHGDVKECMAIANATTRMLEHWWELQTPGIFFGENDPANAYSVIFNYTFSAELFLKAIMMARSANSEYIGGHDLKKLFDALEQTDKEEISKLFKSKCLEGVEEAPDGYGEIDVALEEAKNAFKDWRYAFELNKNLSASVSDLMYLSQAIRARACVVTGINYQTLDEWKPRPANCSITVE